MRTKLAITFTLIAIVGLAMFRDLNVNPYRTISSVSELNTDQEIELRKASVFFEALHASSSENFAKNSDLFEAALPIIEDSKDSSSQMVRLFSNASLMHLYFNTGDMDNFQVHAQNFFTERLETNRADVALQYLNLVLKLTDKFDQEDFYSVVDSTQGISAFAMLLHSNIDIDKLDFDSDEEKVLFNYILNSSIYHSRFSFHLKRNLSPSKDSEFFGGNWMGSFTNFVERYGKQINAPALTQEGEEATIALSASYNLDYLRSHVYSWQYRNDMMKLYLERLNHQNIVQWSKRVENKELAAAALVRYSNFEIKLPTRDSFIKLISDFGADNSMVKSLKVAVKSVNDQVINYYKQQYSKFAASEMSDREILKVEREIFKNQNVSSKKYFGLFHDMMTNSTSLLPVAKEMEIYKKNMAMGLTLNKKHFKLNYALQKLDALWIQNTCFVASAINQNFNKRVIYQAGSPVPTSTLRLKSPYSGISYGPSKYCDLEFDSLLKSISRKAMWQDTKHVVYDAFLIGEESVVLSVLTFMLTGGITQFALKPLMKYSAKLATKELVKAQTKKQAVIQWLKYTAFPKYVVGYFINTMTTVVVKSVLDTGVALITGKTKHGFATLKSYLYGYTVFYLSLPPAAFLVSRGQAAILKPVAAILPKMTKYLPKVKMSGGLAKLAKRSPITKADLSTIKAHAVINLNTSLQMLPAFYVGDLVEYIKSGKEMPLSKDDISARFNYLSNWMFAWQVMAGAMAKIPPVPAK